MKSSAVILVASVALASASAIPAQLNRRADGTRADPIWIDIDCSGSDANAHICNLDCYAILCFAAPNPVQYDAKNSDVKRQRSGYSSGLLRTQEATRQKKGISIAQWIIDRLGPSVEETVMANTLEGGWGEIMGPGDAAANEQIGSRVGGQLRSNVPDGDWYFKWFTNYGAAEYCSALQGGIQTPHATIPAGGVRPDISKCPKKGKKAEDPANIMFMREAKDGEDGKPRFHMMDFDAGDRWTGKPWLFQGSYPSVKRDLQGDGEIETELKA